MHTGELVFAQLIGHLPPMVFECRVAARYGGNHLGRKQPGRSCPPVTAPMRGAHNEALSDTSRIMSNVRI